MAEERERAVAGDGAVEQIDELRRRIDAIDEQLVALLNERAGCALTIGRLKQALRMRIFQPAREAEVLGHVQAVTVRMGGPLSPAALARLFERIIDENRRLEREAAGRHDGGESDVLGPV